MGRLEDLERQVAELTRIVAPLAGKRGGLDGARLEELERQLELDINNLSGHEETCFERHYAIGHAILDLYDHLGHHDPAVERALAKAGITRRR